MPDNLQTLEKKVQSLEKQLGEQGKLSEQRFEKNKYNIKDVLFQNDKMLNAKLKANQQEDAKRAAVIESQADQSAKNVQTLVRKFGEIDSHLKTSDSQIKANTDDTEGNRQALIRARKYVDTEVKGMSSQIRATAVESEENRLALVRARKYVDDHDTTLEKKITELKKIISEMEKRHVKLIDSQIKNYDKLIRKVISQEVAKAAKGKR
ncbi:MAG: hypothetical protein COB16_08060 [Rhodobacteraceae bacterium]|nr:MAG: hypothetical protein COB16_08060 [Paracoccaceae bacterium]